MPTEHFRSKEAYRKNLAYRHIHGIPVNAKEVCIKGKCHKVQHSKKKVSAGKAHHKHTKRRKTHHKRTVAKR